MNRGGNMSDYCLVITTTDSLKEAEELSFRITEARLSACSQIEGPVTSVYWWQGELEKGEEWKCTFKTSLKKVEELECKLNEIHSYDTPEIIVVPISGGSEDYLAWMGDELGL